MTASMNPVGVDINGESIEVDDYVVYRGDYGMETGVVTGFTKHKLRFLTEHPSSSRGNRITRLLNKDTTRRNIYVVARLYSLYPLQCKFCGGPEHEPERVEQCRRFLDSGPSTW